MRKVIVSTYATLDGFVDNPHLWSLRHWCDEAAAYARDLLFGCDALLFGRVTYQGFAQAWPTMTDEGGFADRMNALRKYVVSTTLRSGGWGETTVLADDVVGRIAELKAQPGQHILSYGSGRLAGTLLAHHLVDEYHIWVHPVVIGSGRPLFPRGATATLDLRAVRQFPTGVVALTYRPVAEPAESAARSS
nr:dihydrofolate reductase family protein [uncultured Actinoplanes sp.]